MTMLRLLVALIYFLLSTAGSPASFQQALIPTAPAHTTEYPALTLRPATAHDINSLTSIIIAAFPSDPQFTYQYRWREQYPADHWNCTREVFERYFENQDLLPNVTIWVVDSPKNGDEDVVEPVALAIWFRVGEGSWRGLGSGETMALMNPILELSAGLNCSNRRDLDPKRAEAFRSAVIAYARSHFVKEFSDRHLHLSTIATHPDYQRRGAAGKLLKWGIDVAEEEKLGISLFASPMGKPVYQHVGFVVKDMVRIQVEGEKEWVEEVAMQYEHAFYG